MPSDIFDAEVHNYGELKAAAIVWRRAEERLLAAQKAYEEADLDHSIAAEHYGTVAQQWAESLELPPEDITFAFDGRPFAEEAVAPVQPGYLGERYGGYTEDSPLHHEGRWWVWDDAFLTFREVPAPEEVGAFGATGEVGLCVGGPVPDGVAVSWAPPATSAELVSLAAEGGEGG